VAQTMSFRIGADASCADGACGQVSRLFDEPEAPQEVTVNSVPFGEVEIRRALTVCAIDGEIGQVQGLVMEPGGHYVTHVLLPKGHMWGRKEVAIPIGAVTKIGTLLIHLSLTKHQVEDLPPVDIDHPAG